jgi:chromosome segregation ATPase
MMSGRQTLGKIDQALTEARAQVAEVEARIETVEQQLAGQRRGQVEDYKALARLRLGALADAAMVKRLDQSEQQVAALLSQREVALTQLKEQIRRAESGLRTLESERSALAARVDSAARAVDAAEAGTQARLAADPDYVARRDRATDAERKAAHAAEKADRSEEEREEKGVSYREDPLFMYLWTRRYGQPEYRAWGLTRWLDGKVARLIGFAEARANYARLNEIPERLREHAAALQAAAGSELAALKTLDEAARVADGIPALDAQLVEAQAELEAIDRRIAQAQSDLQDLEVRRAFFAAGQDEYSDKALALVASELQRDDLMELRREALATPFPEDDLIVARLLEREDEHSRLDGLLQTLRESLARNRQRLDEVETLRTDFKRHSYDRADSQFGDEAMIIMMLGQFLSGVLDRRNLWRVMQEQQRYRPERSDPGFGSGGFGRGTVWGGGLGDARRPGDIFGGLGRGSSGGGPGKRGRSSGGFRTGGGF